MKKQLFIGVVALGLSSIALANGDVGYAPPAPAYNPGVYIGLQGGYALSGYYYEDHSTNEDGFAGRAFLGYDFHPNFAIEAGFTYLFNTPKYFGYKIETLWGIDLMGKIKAKVVDNFGLYAKAGVDYLHATPASGSNFAKDSFGPAFGVGASYDFTPNFSADLSWTRFCGAFKKTASDAIPDRDFFALGLAYKFNLS